MTIKRTHKLFQKEYLKKNNHLKILDLGCTHVNYWEEANHFADIVDYTKQFSEKNLNFTLLEVDKKFPFKDKEFDYVILSQTLQAFMSPENVIKNLIRVGKKVIVTIPNFGHWKVRVDLLFKGEMPITKNLPYEWYNTPNLHMCTIQDFYNFCNSKGISIFKTISLNGKKTSKITSSNLKFKNLISELGIFLLEK